MGRETVFIGFGSNVGDRVDFCDRAVTLLSLLPHSQVVGVSLLYETAPVNDHAQPGDGWFLNGVVQLETDVAPKSLLDILREIERSLGRNEENRSGPRTMIWTPALPGHHPNGPISYCRPRFTNAGSVMPLTKSIRVLAPSTQVHDQPRLAERAQLSRSCFPQPRPAS